MVASRARLLGTCCSARFWLMAGALALLPSSVGYQDLVGSLARQPGVPQQSGEHLMGSPFGAVEAATFSYSRPIGTAMPAPPLYQLVSFDPAAPQARNWEIDAPLAAHTASEVEYPTVNRRLKGDRLPVLNAAPSPSVPETLPQLQPVDAPVAAPPIEPVQPPPAPPAVTPLKSSQLDDIGSPAPLSVLPLANVADDDVPPMAQPAQLPPQMATLQFNLAAPETDQRADAPALSSPDRNLETTRAPERAVALDADVSPTPAMTAASFIDADTAQDSSKTFFGAVAMGSALGLESWAPGAEPIPALASDQPGYRLASVEPSAGEVDVAPESAATKSDGATLESPADRLQLAGQPRARAERCLADAVYFEARGEPRKGQEAVAQVVMNRVFSGYYPKDVCGVVFQNANRHLACQFTFACEGKDLTRIDEPDMWEQAKEIAKDTLDGNIWLPDVGHATHYHAYWVHPSWVHEMTRVLKLGVHTFYRPRAWGDGDDEPAWGKAPSTSKADAPGDSAAAKTADPVKGPQAAASPVPAVSARTAKL